jgi:hypothetical protein
VTEIVATYPLLFLGTLLVGALLGAGAMFFTTTTTTADDEAPIRVRNGSLDLSLEDLTQEWEEIGNSGAWRVRGKTKSSDTFEITVHPKAGATCTGTRPVTQPYVRLTYKANNADVITLDAPGHFTRVNPSNGVRLTSPAATPYRLTYDAQGYIAEIAAGRNPGQLTVLCSFANDQQLDYMIIRTP